MKVVPKAQPIRRSPRLHNIMMKDHKNNQHSFRVQYDQQIFRNVPQLPTIHMDFDNDNESDWEEIERNVHEMGLALSVATFDNHSRN